MESDNETIYKCPDCRAPMVIRYNQSEGKDFLGCKNFPACKHTEPYEVEDELNGVPDAASVWE